MSEEKKAMGQNSMEAKKITESQKAIENRKEDKKAFKKFLVMILISGLAGGIVGYMSVGTRGIRESTAERLLAAAGIVLPFGNIIFTTVLLIVLSLLIRRCKQNYAGWDGEEESLIEGIERKLGYGLIAINIYMVISYFLFGAGLYALDFEKALRNRLWTGAAAAFFGIIYAMVVIVWFQKDIINLTKEINPEKHGSVYDARFQKKWLESCDELERLQIYKAGYKAYNAVNYACLGLWVFTAIGILVWDFGMLPMTMVTIIWLAAGGTYGAECIRLTKHPAELMK